MGPGLAAVQRLWDLLPARHAGREGVEQPAGAEHFVQNALDGRPALHAAPGELEALPEAFALVGQVACGKIAVVVMVHIFRLL